jgi:hypothetical protein
MIDLPKWIDDAPDQRARDFRTPVLVILHSIASAPTLRQCMTIKEGILLAIGFDSPRFTKDIDFSTDQKLQSLSLDETKKTLDHQLALAPDQLGVDLALADGLSILAYSTSDLIAEKFRALIQQESRNRFRRQDFFDLGILIARPFSLSDKAKILSTLIAKSEARKITPRATSLAEPQVRERAARDDPTLADELPGALPNFDSLFDRVNQFYLNLPWYDSPPHS